MAVLLDFSFESVGILGDDKTYNMEREAIDIPIVLDGISYRCTCVAGEEIYCVMPFRLVTPRLAFDMGKKIERSGLFSKPVNTIIAQVVDRHNIIIEFRKHSSLFLQYEPIREDLAYIAVSALNKMRYVSNDVRVENRGAVVRVLLDK